MPPKKVSGRENAPRIEIVLSSIPHTGTKFTERLFTSIYFDARGLFEDPRQRRTLYVGHMVKEGQTNRALELARRLPLVCPLRHPYLVEESWTAAAGLSTR